MDRPPNTVSLYRTPLLALVACLGLGLLMSNTAQAAPAPDLKVSIDAHIEKARTHVLTIQRRVQALKKVRRKSKHITVFQRGADDAYTVKRIGIQADADTLIQHPITLSAKHATKRLGRVAVPRIASALTVTGTVRSADQTLHLKKHIAFDKIDLEGSDLLVVSFESGGLFTEPQLAIKVWRPDSTASKTRQGLLSRLASESPRRLRRFVPGSRLDPRVRHAQWLASKGQAATAFNELVTIRHALDSSTIPNVLLWALAETSLTANLIEQARTYLARLAKTKADSLRLAHLRLRFAESLLARGKPRQAQNYLTKHMGQHPLNAIMLEWQAVMARIQLAMQHYEAAAAVFDSAQPLINLVHDKLENPEQTSQLLAYSRFNRAIAYIHSDDGKRGRTWLNIVGQMPPINHQIRVLRDKANTVLGQQLLRHHHALAAVAVFSRVHLDSPFAKQALLGMGWALFNQTSQSLNNMDRDELIGSQLDNTMLSDFVLETLTKRGVLSKSLYGKNNKRTNIIPAAPSRNKAEATRRALRYWLRLDADDIRSPAAQEGLLAIAKAYAILGDKAGAAQRYRHAIQRYKQAINTVERAKKRVQDRQWLSSMLKQLTIRHSKPKVTTDTARAWARYAAINHTGLRFVVRDQHLDTMERRLNTISQQLQALDDRDSAISKHRKIKHKVQQARSALDKLRLQSQRIMRKKLTQSLTLTRTQLRDYLATAYSRLLNLTSAN